MPDLFADDLFEICGTHIQISTIKDYRIGQIEFIKRPVYYERSRSKWGGLFMGLFIRGSVRYQITTTSEDKQSISIPHRETEGIGKC